MAYPAGVTASYNNCPCLFLQQVATITEQEAQYTKEDIGFVDLLKSNENVSNSPIKVKINNDGKTQDTTKPGAFTFVYYPEDCNVAQPAALGACTAASGGEQYAGKQNLEYVLNKTFTFSIQINTQEAIDKCYTIDTIKAELFGSKRAKILQNLEYQLLGEVTGGLGKYESQTLPTNSVNTPAVINFLNPGTLSDPNLATGLQVARQYIRQNDKNVKPLWLGQSIGLVEMQKERTPNDGVYLSDGLNDAMVDIVGVTNVEYMWGVPAGTYQLATWNRYVGDYAVPFNSRGVPTEKMAVDMWGFTWDVTVTRDLCNDYMHFQLNYGLVKAPTLNCGTRDALNFLVGCGVTNCAALQALFGTQTSFSGGVGA
jgi:hypothetical protein